MIRKDLPGSVLFFFFEQSLVGHDKEDDGERQKQGKQRVRHLLYRSRWAIFLLQAALEFGHAAQYHPEQSASRC